MVKKMMIVAATFLVIMGTSMFGTTNTAGAAIISCSGNSRCVDISMKYGVAQYWSTPKIYFSKGEEFKYDFGTTNKSLFHVAFAVFRLSDGKQITPWSYAAGKGGIDYSYGDIPSTGYYYMMAACKGGDDTRCEGGGTLKKW
ncbi:hypothetical protein MXL46_21170 [Heyndrickxia sporothermodurans]|uniref:Uncharacterized protein n=1 Tax=Heyndrickxia sporothermodurans TaxID=46224 RepID=A0A150KL42_9BACI|nr:hypothetical protein [Heyndrickxia sporothermodurans]KYC91360.1 hypothetical protein B4102_3807 [Heyndrickxia sporothermodurans]MBL5767510.1 hypothetical protein [Heyndrickxia sporothermodurans]MBL5770975.1 hypothetical protein [Heyndrickxia sporothermodurans]MBL5774645.1 hypothetical protein [Heyndrickxia sporothermodurans]MBL5777735.1 hypothetical protein [Heyndrickxia sporothermodurans]